MCKTTVTTFALCGHVYKNTSHCCRYRIGCECEDHRVKHKHLNEHCLSCYPTSKALVPAGSHRPRSPSPHGHHHHHQHHRHRHRHHEHHRGGSGCSSSEETVRTVTLRCPPPSPREGPICKLINSCKGGGGGKKDVIVVDLRDCKGKDKDKDCDCSKCKKCKCGCGGGGGGDSSDDDDDKCDDRIIVISKKPEKKDDGCKCCKCKKKDDGCKCCKKKKDDGCKCCDKVETYEEEWVRIKETYR